MIRRREFITLVGGVAAAWPLAAWAQQGDRVRRIGVLIGGDENDPVWKPRLSAFTQALAALGWTDRRNVDLRWTGDDSNRARALAQELVGLQLDVILTSGTPATVAVQRETRTIPIVFASVNDPVATGIVARLDRPPPGGNRVAPTAGGAVVSVGRLTNSPSTHLDHTSALGLPSAALVLVSDETV